jgi:transcriptional regulator with XRE-family HTH domain
MDIGERLLVLRQTKGLSQRELAKRAGVTNSAISMIETNRVSPSISSLEKILSGMAMSLAEFFSPSPIAKLDYQVVYKASDLLDISLDEVAKQLVGKYFIKERAMNMTIQTYPAGSVSVIEASHEIGEKAGYLVKGEMTLELQGEKYNLLAGDSVYFESHLKHCFINKGTEALLLCVSTSIEE